ncbi:MAG: hypothetical protein QME76_10645 [Bacillota bacterium]|nr:hypothetical protein [Bacillota bacterium]
MATQLQPTPTLYGKDAEKVLEQVRMKPTQEQLQRARKRSEYFERIKKKNF